MKFREPNISLPWPEGLHQTCVLWEDKAECTYCQLKGHVIQACLKEIRDIERKILAPGSLSDKADVSAKVKAQCKKSYKNVNLPKTDHLCIVIISLKGWRTTNTTVTATSWYVLWNEFSENNKMEWRSAAQGDLNAKLLLNVVTSLGSTVRRHGNVDLMKQQKQFFLPSDAFCSRFATSIYSSGRAICESFLVSAPIIFLRKWKSVHG